MRLTRGGLDVSVTICGTAARMLYCVSRRAAAAGRRQRRFQMPSLVVWALDAQRYALPLSAVDRVVRAVAVTPLPDAPAVISGVVDMHAQLVPVVDMRMRLHLPRRDAALTDLLLLARSATRLVAFFADTVSGAIEHAAEPLPAGADARKGCIAGVVRLTDGVILIQDLDRLLSLDEERGLDLALARRAGQ